MIGINNNKQTKNHNCKYTKNETIQKNLEVEAQTTARKGFRKNGLEESWFLARGLLMQEILQMETSACSESELVFGYGFIYTATLYEGKQMLVLKESWFLAYVDTGMERFQKTYTLS